MKVQQFEGYTIYLGTSAKENWELLGKAKPHHYFFHLSSFPSGYVILEYTERLTETMIRECAEICKASTKYRNLKKLKVDYCPCSNVTKGEKIGEAMFKSNRKVKQVTVSVKYLNFISN